MDEFERAKANYKRHQDYYRWQAAIAPAFLFWVVFTMIVLSLCMAIAGKILATNNDPSANTLSDGDINMLLLSLSSALIWLLIARFRKKRLPFQIIGTLIVVLLIAPFASFLIFRPPSDHGGFLLLWTYGMIIASLISGAFMFFKLRDD